MKRNRTTDFILAGVCLVVLAGAIASLLVRNDDGDSVLDIAYVVLLLFVLLFFFPAVREWARGIKQLTLPGGIEVLMEVSSAMESVGALPRLEDQGPERRATESLRILKEDWKRDADGAIATLCETATKRRVEIDESILGTSGSGGPITEWFQRMADDALLSHSEARLGQAVFQVSGKDIEQRLWSPKGVERDEAERFVVLADLVIGQMRSRIFEKLVRQQIAGPRIGLSLLEFPGQAGKRWPDFFVFNRKNVEGGVVRVSARTATDRDSSYLRSVEKRILTKRGADPSRKPKWETPLDPNVRTHLIVVPNGSKSELKLENKSQDFSLELKSLEELEGWLLAWKKEPGGPGVSASDEDSGSDD